MEQRKIHKAGIVIAMLILLSTIVTAIPAGEPYNVKTIDDCEGQVQVKARAPGSNGSEYTFPGCSFNGTYWFCDCTNPTTIRFLPENETRNQYDIVLQWYGPRLEGNKLTEENKQTQWFMNINVGPKPKPKEELKMPTLEGVELVGVILFGVSVFFVVLLIIIWKWLMKENKVEKVSEVEEDKDFNEVLDEYTK